MNHTTSKPKVQLWATGDKKLRNRLGMKAREIDMDMQDLLRIGVDLVVDQLPASFFRDGGSYCVRLDEKDAQ